MGQVTISGNTVTTFGDVDGSKTYHSFNINSAAFDDNDDKTTRGKALVTATRWMGQLDLRDPDTNADIEPTADDTGVPEDVINAAYELQLALLADPTLQTKLTQSSGNIKRVGAGSAAVEFFRPESGLVLPKAVLRYLSPYLSSEVDGLFGSASGTSGRSSFCSADYPGLEEPFA